MCVGGTVAASPGPRAPVGSPHTAGPSGPPAGTGGPAGRVSVQQSPARRRAQAYPLILQGGRGAASAHPGQSTVAVVWTLVPAVRFGSPSSSPASGPSPSPTSLWAPGLRCHWPHAPPPKPAHTRNPQPPLDSALPARGPSTGPRTPVHRRSPGTPEALQPEGPRPVPTHQRPSPRAQQACFSLRTSLTQQQADASPGYP